MFSIDKTINQRKTQKDNLSLDLYMARTLHRGTASTTSAGTRLESSMKLKKNDIPFVLRACEYLSSPPDCQLLFTTVRVNIKVCYESARATKFANALTLT